MRAGLIALALSLAATAAQAGTAVTLKSDVSSPTAIVRLGDIFEGAGAAAKTPVATRGDGGVALNARMVQIAAARAGLDWANAEGLKTIIVRGGPTASAAGPARAGNVEVLTYARNIASGEIVGPTDLVWSKAAAQPADAPGDADAIIGLAAKRPLREGAAAMQHDVAAPVVIKTGEIITVVYQADGISLSLQGKALAAGSVGETLNVENTTSKKTIQAVVSGPGQAVVGPAADQLKTSRTRYASR
jgi:flagella basal body P-ring formation protein FlgA